MSWLKKLVGLEQEPLPVISVNDENFRAEVLESDVPVLLDVWSPTCAPCKQLESVVVDLAKHYAGRLKVTAVLGANIAWPTKEADAPERPEPDQGAASSGEVH